jgi:YHS domain-containing protein/thiol-disulfide isomerase/thioredoxin
MHVIIRTLRTGVLFLAMTSTCLAQNVAIQWQQDLATAQKLAADSNRLVLVHFWAPWCAPCLRLEQQVFNQSVVARAVQENFIPVKVNADESREIAQRFGLAGLPADVVLTPAGQVVARLRCPPTADAYAAQIVQVATARRAAAGGGAGRYDPRYTAAGGKNLAAVGATAVTEHNSYAGAASGASPHGTAAGAAAPPINNPYVGLGSAATMGPPQVPYQPNPIGTGSRYRPTARQVPQVAGQGAPGGLVPRGSDPAGPSGTAYGTASAWPQRQPSGSLPGQTNRYSAAPPPPAGQAGGTPRAPSVAGPRYRNTWQPPGSGSAAPPVVQPAQQWRASPVVPGAATHQQSSPSVAVAQNSAASQTGSNPLGMDGYCAVTLKQDQRWIPGDRRWGVNHRGRTYLFASAEAQRRFLADPDAYSPVLSGIDPVLAIDQGRSISGQRRHGVFFDGQVYLFSNETSLQQFSKNPKRYASGIRQALQTTPNRIGPR